MRNIHYFIIASALAMIISPLSTFAAASSTPADTSPTCNLLSSIEKLVAVKEQAEKSATSTALDAYTEILEKVIHCSIAEIESFEAKLDVLDNLSEEDSEYRSAFTLILENYKTFYEESAEELKDAATVEEVKELAAKVLAWRKENYNPQAKNIANFIFVFRGKEAIEITDARLKKISLALLDAGLLFRKENWREFNALLNKAQTNISAAKKLNGQAYTMLMEQLNPIATSSTTSTTLAATITKATITDLLKESLFDIRAAYDIFGDIGKLVKKILG